MGVPVFGMLCLGLFVLLMMAAGIAVLVMFIKLVSGSAPAAPPTPRMTAMPDASASPSGALLKVGVFAVIGFFLLGGLLFTSVRTVRMDVAHAIPSEFTPPPPEQFNREAEQIMQRAREDADAAIQRARQQAEAAMERARREIAGPIPVPPNLPQPPLVATPQPVSAVDALAAASAVALSEPPISDRTTVEPATAAGPPAWITAGAKTNGETQTLVVSSKQYATQAEAEQDIGRQVVELLRKDLRKHTSHAWVQPSEIIGIPEASRLAVRDQYVETVNRDFGSFFAPMYRVWCRVELSPQVREPALVRWRTAVAQSRMMATGGGMVALLCVPLAIVAFGRCNRWTNGRLRTPLACGLGGLVLAVWAVGGLAFAKLFVLWG